MPNVSRRGFLQVLGGIGVAPYLPTMPAPAAAATGSTSKALWASLYAKAGSTSEFVSVAKGMGLSNTAIQGVSARTLGIRVALAASSNNLANASAKSARQSLTSDETLMTVRRKLEGKLKRYIPSEETRADITETEQAENRMDETASEPSENEDCKTSRNPSITIEKP